MKRLGGETTRGAKRLVGAKRLGGKRLGGKRLGGETTRGRNGLGAKRPGFFLLTLHFYGLLRGAYNIILRSFVCE